MLAKLRDSRDSRNLTHAFSSFAFIWLPLSQVAKRSNGLSSKGFLKIVEAPPKLLEAREHGKIVLTCSASGNPAPEITWFKNGAPLVKKASATYLHILYVRTKYRVVQNTLASGSEIQVKIGSVERRELSFALSP